jgi:hypothetical protein
MRSVNRANSLVDAARLLALELFREDKVSLGRAAELCETPVEAFMEFAGIHQAPLHYGAAELEIGSTDARTLEAVTIPGRESHGNMLGWHISVYRQEDGGAVPATVVSPKGTRLAVWQTGIHGLHWLDELVKLGAATYLGGNGYPLRYTATAEYLVPRIIERPPEALPAWVCDEGDILTDKWEGKTVVDLAMTAQCRLDEWLLVEAWDES